MNHTTKEFETALLANGATISDIKQPNLTGFKVTAIIGSIKYNWDAEGLCTRMRKRVPEHDLFGGSITTIGTIKWLTKFRFTPEGQAFKKSALISGDCNKIGYHPVVGFEMSKVQYIARNTPVIVVKG